MILYNCIFSFLSKMNLKGFMLKAFYSGWLHIPPVSFITYFINLCVKLPGDILTWLADWTVLPIVWTGRNDCVDISTDERLVAVDVTKLWLDEFLLLFVIGKFSCKTVAAGDVERPVGLLSDIGPFVNATELGCNETAAGCENEDVANGNDVDDNKDDIAPVFLVWTCVVLITADTANLALAESNINRDVGWDEKDWSRPEHPALSKSQVVCFNSCSSWSLCICNNCSRWDWKLSRLNSSSSLSPEMRSLKLWSSSVGECGRKYGLKYITLHAWHLILWNVKIH